MGTKTTKSKKEIPVAAAGASVKDGKSLEARLSRMLRLPSEEEADRLFNLAKGRGLAKGQLVLLVETILQEQNKIVFGKKIIEGDLQTHQDDRMDEADQASSDNHQGMTMRMANRENFKLKRLQRALDKVYDGSFGECEGCGVDIGFARLSARPIADLCIVCKEEEERKENLSAVGRKPKSMGQTLGSKLSVG
jgi:DnaK suppressor protein